jgi:hypothetical protein
MNQLEWENNYIQQELQRHVGMVFPDVVGVLTTPVIRRRYATALAPFAESQIRVFEKPDAVEPEGLGVLVVVGGGQWPTLSLAGKVPRDHVPSLPIVSCTVERQFARGAVSPDKIGIDYDGMFWLASKYIPMVTRGAYVEFGVFDGNTMTRAFHALKGVCSGFYAFDSFQGIGGAMESEKTHFKDGQYAASLDSFRYNLRLHNVDDTRIQAVPGFFQDTLPGRQPSDFGITQASIVHIDTDVYEPALLSLEFIAPALPQGALLMFDDYDHLQASNDKGERRAVRDWLAKHPEFELEPYRNYGVCCRSFIVHRRA